LTENRHAVALLTARPADIPQSHCIKAGGGIMKSYLTAAAMAFSLLAIWATLAQFLV
jgi:hypothetical protein